jgi:hypothetical protein
MKKLLILLLGIVSVSSFAQGRNPQWPVYVNPGAQGQIPQYFPSQAGIPVLGPSNLTDNGNVLLYKGSPIGSQGGGSINLTVLGTAGAATLNGSLLNIPVYQGQVTLTTVGSNCGPATFIFNTLNIPPCAPPSNSITLTVLGTSGAATLSAGTLNIPIYQGQLTFTTTGSNCGLATFVGNTLNIPPCTPASGMVYPTGDGIPLVVGGASWGTTIAPGTGIVTFLQTPTSANLAAAVTGETGTGALVFATTPTLVTPVIGVATGTSLTLSGLMQSLSAKITGVPSAASLATDASGNVIAGSSFTNPMTTLGDMFYGGAAGVATRIPGPITGTVPYNYCSTPSGGVATAPTWCLAGISGRTVSGTTDSITAADRGGSILYTSTSAVAVTLPSAASLGNNFDFVTQAQNGSGVITITTSGGTFLNSTGGTSTTQTFSNGQSCAISSPDNLNYISRCTQQAVTAGISIPLIANAAAAGVAASTTGYIAATNYAPNFTGSTTNRQMAFPHSGTISNMTVCLISNQTATGSMTIAFQTGTYGSALTNTPLQVVLAASAALGCYSDTTDSFTYTAGQGIDIQLVNAGTATSGFVGTIYAEFTNIH